MLLPAWLNTNMLQSIGWTLIHSLWQSLLLLLLLKLALLFIHKKNSGLRYLAAVITVFATVVCTAVTFQLQYSSPGIEQAAAYTLQPAHDAAPANAITADTAAEGAAVAAFNLQSLLTEISPWLSICWMAGLLFCAFRIVHSWRHLNKLRKLSSISYQPAFDSLEKLCRKMALSRPVQLILSDKIAEPLTFGHFKPLILIPFSYASQVPIAQLDMILAHELAHIRRNDFMVNMLQSVLDAVFFFNPFFYGISKIVRVEREYSCDDMAAALCGDKETMALALTNLKIFSTNPALALAAAPARGSFHQRIYRLVKPGTSYGRKIPLASLILLCSFLFLLSRCINDMGYAKELPQANDSIHQVYADNQANHKIEIYNYTRENTRHEIFMVSTLEGNPQYAYLDGDTLTTAEVTDVHKRIRDSRYLAMQQIANAPPTSSELRSKRSAELNNEIDALEKEIKVKAASMNNSNRAVVKPQLDSLYEELGARNNEQVKLSMEGYKEDVKDIPSSVGMHEILVKIINSRKYTPEDRQKVNELLNSRK